MTLCQAIKDANKRSRNINLQWFVCKWNDGYIIHSSTYMKRYPDTKFIYSTGPLLTWRIVYDLEEYKFKHVIK